MRKWQSPGTYVPGLAGDTNSIRDVARRRHRVTWRRGRAQAGRADLVDHLFGRHLTPRLSALALHVDVALEQHLAGAREDRQVVARPLDTGGGEAHAADGRHA